jgi:nitrogen fixation/metabolism regulation signal transduction histidine kinase
MAEKIAAWQAMGRKLAHEVKNPLTPISISIDDLRRSYSEHRPEFEQILKETTATTKNEINRLTKLIDQFVDFARMNPPEITSMRPEEVIDPVKALYRSSLADHQLKFNNMSLRDHWRVDPEQIRQVLINLIKNSFESAEGVQVTVDITDSRDGITIQIEDTGPGFPDEVLRAGFQPYLSKKADGTGLGLVISQRIVHDHGGTIELYNRKAGGAGVSITLPFSHG